MIEELIKDYINTGYDAELMLKIAKEYHKIGQTASAVTFYFKVADNAPDDVAYDCLINIGECFSAQQNREGTVRIMYYHALNLMPERHEAYYLLSKNWAYCNDNQSAYYFIKEALKRSKNTEVILQAVECAWHWGKHEESWELFAEVDPDSLPMDLKIRYNYIKDLILIP